jgi:hypothetical protein
VKFEHNGVSFPRILAALARGEQADSATHHFVMVAGKRDSDNDTRLPFKRPFSFSIIATAGEEK